MASIQSITADVNGLRDDLRTVIQSMQVDNDTRSQVSAISNIITANNCNSSNQGGTMMGGRNERANNGNISKITTIRRV